MKTAFIIGNGPTRNSIDLNKLVGKGTIYGCNALYRDFDKYDYLISIDKQFQEIITSLYDPIPDNIIFPPEKDCFEETTGRRNNAGMVAMKEAIKNDHTKLFCLGFDFLLANDKTSTDNIYKDTEGYGIETHANASDNINRIAYLEWFMRKHSNVRFTFVLPFTDMYRITSDNAFGINIDNFKINYVGD